MGNGKNSYQEWVFDDLKNIDYIEYAFYFSYLLPLAFLVRDSVTLFGAGLEKYIMLLMVFIWVISVIERRDVRRPCIFHILTSGLLVWSLSSLLWSVDFNRTLSSVVNTVVIGSTTLIIWDLYRTDRQIELGLLSYVVSAFIIAILVLVNFTFGTLYGPGRYTALGLNPNTVATTIVFSIPISWYLLVDSRRLQIPVTFLISSLLVISAAVLLTGSRQGFVALFLGAFYPAWTLFSDNRLRMPSHKISGAVVIFFGIFVILTRDILKRYLTIPFEILGGNIGDRLVQWTGGWILFQSQPLLGIGANAFNTAIEPLIGYQVATDNTYLHILYELGIIGFLLYAVLLIFFCRQAWNAFKSGNMLWITLLLIWLIVALVNDLIWKPVYWLLFSYLVASRYSATSPKLLRRMDSVKNGN